MKYALRRIAMLLITMLIVSFLAFAAFALVSGDPAQATLLSKNMEMSRFTSTSLSIRTNPSGSTSKR